MDSPHSNAPGTIAALWRDPVKSMQGEELNASLVGQRGLLGDRSYALVDGPRQSRQRQEPAEMAEPLRVPG